MEMTWEQLEVLFDLGAVFTARRIGEDLFLVEVY